MNRFYTNQIWQKRIIFLSILFLFINEKVSADVFKVGSMTYGIVSLEAKTLEIAYPSVPTGDYIIPRTVTIGNEEYNIIGIGKDPFLHCPQLRSITIPDHIQYIKNDILTFYDCPNFTSIVVSEGNNKYSSKDGILFNKNQTTLLRYPIGKKDPIYNIPTTVNKIANNAFMWCSHIKEIVIPQTVSLIEMQAFSDCTSLEKINIPNTITKLEQSLFMDCSNLKTLTLPSSISSMGMQVFCGCENLEEIIIPDEVTELGDLAFSRCSALKKIHLPNKLRKIGERGFESCLTLQEIILPEGLTNIGKSAFSNCKGLKSIKLPNSVTDIGESSFFGLASLNDLTLSENLSIIPEHAFSNCNVLEKIIIPTKILNIGEYAFDYCGKLKEVHCKNATTPPNCLQNIFNGINLSNVTLYVPNHSARKIYQKTEPWNQFRYILKEGQRIAFTWANLSYGHVSEPEHTIEVTACENHSISEYIIPETIEKDGITYTVVGIGENAFDGCTHLQSVTIPASVTNIKDEVFANCTNLNAVHFKRTGTVPTIGSEVFKGLDMQAITAYVPKGCKKLYTDWGVFVNVVEEGEEPNQPVSPSDATLKSLSYKIGDNGQVITIPEFDPNRYKYEVPYYSNEDAVGQGGSPVYSDAELESLRVYPVVEANNPNATVKVTDVLLRQCGFAKVNVISADGSKTNTYTFIMVSQKDAGKKYYVMMNLKNMTVQINGTTYKNGDIYKANHNEDVTVKLIPDQGYKPPREMAIDEGSSTLIGEELTHSEDEINLGEINWHMGLILSAVKDEGQEDNTIFVHNNLKYRITGNNTVSVVGPDVAEGSGTQGNDNDSWTVTDCVIPSTITYNSTTYQVKTIEDGAFSGAINMKTITLPEGLETIGYEAFYRCYELKTLHIPASVTSIKVKEDEIFFSKLDIESISVASDNKVYTSLDGLLYNKSMTTLLFCPYFNNNREITLPEGVTTLRQYVFAYQDSLISVTLPESLKSISNYAFYQCDGLVNIHLKGQQPPLAAESAFESSKLVHLIAYVPKGYKNAYTDWGVFLPENIIEEGSEEEADTFIEGLFKYRKLTENTVAVIGSTITGNACDIISPVTHNNKTYQVTEIGDEAFSGLNIEKGSIPEGIRKIGSKAYENCALLEYMILPSSIEEIEYEAFNGCKKLERIQLNDGLKYIGDDAFNNTALTSIQIPASVIEIENLCEDCPSLMGIDVDSKNAYYSSEGGILYDKKQTVMLMVPQAYAGDIFSLPETLKSIDVGAFYKCKGIKTIDLPEGIEIIGECAFSLCGATSITLPSSLKQLDMCVFGDHREAIGVLKELHSKHTDPAKIKIESNTFAYVIDFNTCKLYVPKGCKAKYQAAEGWKEFKQIIEEGDNLPLIPDKTDDEITLNTDSTYTDGEGNTGHFNGMIGNGEEETAINKLTIRGSASSTTTTIVINKVTVGNGSSTSETTTSVTKNTNVVIELIGDNSLGKVVNDGIAKLIRKVEAALKNTVVINNGIFVDETGLLTRVEGAAELDITAPSDQEVRPGENVTLTASTKVSVTYAVTFIWEQLQPDGTWKAVGSPNVYTPARSGLRSTATVTDRLTIQAKDAGKYRCVIRNKVGDVSSTLTTPPATVTAKSTVDIVTPKSYRKVTPCGNQLHFEISTPTEVKIINLNGAIIRSVSLPAGDTYIDGLDKGVYILLFEDGVTQKVRI